MTTLLWIFLIVVLVLWFLLILGINLIRIRNMRALRKEAQRILDNSEQNLQYWMNKLENEQQKMQDAMDILNREYYEQVLEKRKNQIRETESIEAPTQELEPSKDIKKKEKRKK